MQYQIITTSKYAEHNLYLSSSATVHSVYRNTINIYCGQTLISLQSANTVLSPVSLITNLSVEDFEKLPYKPGDTIVVTIDKSTCDIKDLKFPALSNTFSVKSIVSSIERAIYSTHTGGFRPIFSYPSDVSNSEILTVASSHIKASSKALYKGDITTSTKELCQLIGLGPGLTPSGDDFICGVLAGLCFLNMRDHPLAKSLKEQVSHHLQDTNDISRTFLLCALSEQFSEPVIKLTDPARHDVVPSSFAKIGHSSGIDTLCGIYYICSQFANY